MIRAGTNTPTSWLRLALSMITVVALAASATPALAADPWVDEDFSGDVDAIFDGGWGFKKTSDGHVGPGLVSEIPRGEHWGTSGHVELAPRLGSAPDEMYWRYWLRFPVGFEVDEDSRGKLPGPAGLYSDDCRGNRVSTASDPCWSARMLFSPLLARDGLPERSVDIDSVTRIGSYVYDLSDSDVGRQRVLPWDADAATLDHGRWYCVEGRIQMNTPGSSDGILQGWVNGAEAFDQTDIRFRRSGEGSMHVKSLWFDVYYGGSAESPVDNEIHFDSLALGPDRIGCDDGSGNFSGTFSDDDDSIFEEDIERLAASGITRGCADNRFCPEDHVTRGQMAAFLHRALADRFPDVSTSPPPSPPSFFGARSDVDYKDVLDGFADAGAPLDTYIITTPIDRGGSQDWLATGNDDNPNKWVPIKLENIWQGGATPYIRVTVGDFDGLLAGKHDERVANMMSAFAAFTSAGEGRRVLVDILPSGNKDSLSYGDRPSDYITAYRRLADRARSTIGSDVRTVFAAERVMISDRYSPSDHGLGGYSLFWPGIRYVDVAGIVSGVGPDSNPPSVQQVYNAAVEEMGGVAVDVPIILAATGVDTGDSARAAWLQEGAAWVAGHAQLMGLQYEDVAYASQDLRVTDGSGNVPAAFADAASGLIAGGADWMFSDAYHSWRDSRAGLIAFSDTGGSVFRDDIRWLAATGITRGCADSRFCPEDPVTRGQMAAFLGRALGLPASDGSIDFSDTRGHTFESEIDRLASAGITRGCTDTRFCPNDAVTRGQMAAFLVRSGLTD